MPQPFCDTHNIDSRIKQVGCVCGAVNVQRTCILRRQRLQAQYEDYNRRMPYLQG